jgi:hypothetical protein
MSIGPPARITDTMLRDTLARARPPTASTCCRRSSKPVSLATEGHPWSAEELRKRHRCRAPVNGCARNSRRLQDREDRGRRAHVWAERVPRQLCGHPSKSRRDCIRLTPRSLNVTAGGVCRALAARALRGLSDLPLALSAPPTEWFQARGERPGRWGVGTDRRRRRGRLAPVFGRPARRIPSGRRPVRRRGALRS